MVKVAYCSIVINIIKLPTPSHKRIAQTPFIWFFYATCVLLCKSTTTNRTNGVWAYGTDRHRCSKFADWCKCITSIRNISQLVNILSMTDELPYRKQYNMKPLPQHMMLRFLFLQGLKINYFESFPRHNLCWMHNNSLVQTKKSIMYCTIK